MFSILFPKFSTFPRCISSVFQSNVSHNFPGAAVLVPAVSPCLDGASWHGHDLPFGPTDEGLTYLFTFFSEVGMELSWRRKKQQIHLVF